jgi:hypothetical protein
MAGFAMQLLTSITRYVRGGWVSRRFSRHWSLERAAGAISWGRGVILRWTQFPDGAEPWDRKASPRAQQRDIFGDMAVGSGGRTGRFRI